MTTAVQHRRGTTAEHATFTGLEGEVTIDTTKDTAVIHDGTLAGGYPLAKENLANVNPTTLSTIDGASTASDDKFLIWDQSALTLKSITRAELNNAMEADALASVTITGGTINGTTIGGTTPALITGTTITATSGFSGNLTGNVTGDVSGNAGTVTNGLYSTGSYSNPAWITSLAGSKISGDIYGNAATATTATNVSGGTASVTTLSASGAVTLSGGTANGVAYLNGSKVLTTGSALTFDGTSIFGVTSSSVSVAKLFGGTGAGNGAYFALYAQGSNAGYVGTDSGIIGSGTSNDLTLYPAGSNNIRFYHGGSEQMRLTSTGLGIGTSSPTYKLHVLGGASSTVSLFEASTTDVYIGLKNTGVTGFVGLTNAGNFIWQTPSSSYATKLTLDNSGNLGLGVTPSAWATVGPVFQANQASITGYNNQAILSANWYYNAGNKYITNGYATQYSQSSGQHVWYTAPSGTAGNAISFTQAMTLDASGNLLVGTTSATGTPTVGFCLLRDFSAGSASGIAIGHQSGTGGGAVYATFSYNGTGIGSITQNGTTGVLYNLTSDYRLKNNPAALTGAKAFVMALQPKTWDWWDGSGKGVGFIAHEFMEVAKYSGNGTKDAVDADGKPVYQSIQPSSPEVMANLVALIQEQQNTIDQLKARLDAANL
jgi:hypothetical protein